MATNYKVPWSPDYNLKELRDRIYSGHKRVSKKALENADMGYNMSRGYYRKEDDNWGPKPEKPNMKVVRLANGRNAKVYDDNNGVDYVAFNKFSSDQEIADYIDAAKWTYSIEGCGHIARLEYAPYRTMMRVTFQPEENNGKVTGRDDIAIYFRIPTTVFGELYWLAESKVTQASPINGDIRHALGIRFWDLVRIRGKREGGRYPYSVENIGEYAKKGRPVSQKKVLEQQAAERANLNVDLDANRAALKAAAQRLETRHGNTDKDEAVAALFGNAESADNTMHSYALRKLKGSSLTDYEQLTTLTDKYDYMVSHGVFEDFLNEET